MSARQAPGVDIHPQSDPRVLTKVERLRRRCSFCGGSVVGRKEMVQAGGQRACSEEGNTVRGETTTSGRGGLPQRWHPLLLLQLAE